MIVPSQIVNPLGTQPPEKLERVPMKVLGQDEFLQLLVTQMRNQDPMKPMSDTEFIAQMAEFSNLEQTKEMSGDIKELRQSNAFAQGTALMGHHVRLMGNDEKVTNGLVTNLEVRDGEVNLIVNDKSYELDDVVSVSAGDESEE